MKLSVPPVTISAWVTWLYLRAGALCRKLAPAELLVVFAMCGEACCLDAALSFV